MKKMSDEELIEALNRGQTGRDIAEKYGYSRPQRISERIRELKDQGYQIRDTTSQASSGAGIQISISGDYLKALGFDKDEDLYYIRTFDRDSDIRIIIKEENGQKMSKISDSGDRMVYITGKQLSDIGFEETENIFVEKGSNETEREKIRDRDKTYIDLNLYSRRVVEP